MHKANRKKLVNTNSFVCCDTVDCDVEATWKVKRRDGVQFLCSRHHDIMIEYYDDTLDEPMPKVEKI